MRLRKLHAHRARQPAPERVLVLAEGKLLGDGGPDAVLRSQEVRDVYLGSELDEQVPHALN